ncbi:hypothetical protein K438DRAFT_1757780 [Mycena galopus ATCC 62051]|nr:hypothetical protein K438DRAFT_1757780 [Mycena galopus ATCC 62051]
MFARKEDFPVHGVRVNTDLPEVPLASTMEDFGVLPIVVDNTVPLDSRDGVEYLSTYLLNDTYDFLEIVSDVSLRTIHRDDIGTKYIAAAFVAAYHHITIKQLTTLCALHGLGTALKKPNLLILVMGHECNTSCAGSGIVFLFKPAKKSEKRPTPLKPLH